MVTRLRFLAPAMAVVIVVGAVTQFYACQRVVSDISPYPSFVELPRDERVAGVPVVVVGRVLSSERVGNAIASPWGNNRGENYELHRAQLSVEIVLAGTVSIRTLDFFFFRTTRPVGQALLGTVADGGSWKAGQREMLFLQTNKRYLRTVCDTYAHCAIQVSSGFHKPVFGVDMPVGRKIVDVLLTRGEGITDEDFSQAILRGSSDAYDFDRRYTFDILQQLGASDNPIVRSGALKALRNLQ